MADNAVYADYRHLDIAVGDGIAVVTIPVAGSVGRVQAGIHREVARIWRTLGEDADVRVVVVTGTGPDFYQSADASGLGPFPPSPRRRRSTCSSGCWGRARTSSTAWSTWTSRSSPPSTALRPEAGWAWRCWPTSPSPPRTPS